jgi:hypothetical protein
VYDVQASVRNVSTEKQKHTCTCDGSRRAFRLPSLLLSLSLSVLLLLEAPSSFFPLGHCPCNVWGACHIGRAQWKAREWTSMAPRTSEPRLKNASLKHVTMRRPHWVTQQRQCYGTAQCCRYART